MWNLRRCFYRAVSCSALLATVFLVAGGCGKSAAPPEGARQDATAPVIDLGTESGPQDAAATPTDSTPGSGSPQGDQGEKK
jgi:hypothetical protein